MHTRQNITASITALLTLVISTAAAAQTKTNTASPPKKSSPMAARTIPTIKCTDADSMAACKSFKQLVDARDKGLLDSLTGSKDVGKKHFAYVCLRPKNDSFKIVDFYEPSSGEYRSYSPPDLPKNLLSAMEEQDAFPYEKGLPVIPHMDAQKIWYEDHDDFHMYEFDTVYVEAWENGIMADYVSDSGKWRRASFQGHILAQTGASFEGAFEWLTRYSKANDNKLAVIDNPEHAHISIDDTSIYVRYSFKNKNGDFTGYTLNIQRSTGRFTESFAAPGLDSYDDSGTCMSFKF
jgi:hypothetical protein